jgi:cytolysin-activating lysine-acyltransferase
VKAMRENWRDDEIADEDLQFYIPSLVQGEVNRAEALGVITRLWFNSPLHVSWPVWLLNINVRPAIEHRQFLIVRHRTGQPLLYLSWANLDLAREHQYLRDPHSLRPADWNSGQRMWFIDWIAPFGGSRRIASMLRRKIFRNGAANSLRVKAGARVGRIHHHFGCQISSTQREQVSGEMLQSFRSLQEATLNTS